MIPQLDSGDFARFYTVTEPTKHRKGYTVYKVTARIISRKIPEDVREITVWKRYSDFRKLHHNLWQLHKNVCSQSELFPPFAKARVFGRFDDSVIEERRQRLEDLLQFSANIPALYGSRHIRDFFQGGQVHDGSELIGPSEPSAGFLADALCDRSSDVQRDPGCAEELTISSEHEARAVRLAGPSGDSGRLNSPAADTDRHGMASGGASPKWPRGEGKRGPRDPAEPKPEPEPKPERASLFSKRAGGPKEEPGADYLDKAGELMGAARRKEDDGDYRAAFRFYRSAVDLLLQGVQGEASPTRREAVKKKTAEYLMRAERISALHLCKNMGQGSSQAALGSQCCASTSGGSQSSLSDDLHAYRVVGVIDKVLLVTDKRTPEMLVVKALRKSSECGRAKKCVAPRSVPHMVPHMVRLKKLIETEDSVFLLLQHAEGGKLWSHIGKYLRTSNPDESLDIPFIQKSHTAAVHSPQCADWASRRGGELSEPAASPGKGRASARLCERAAAQTDSGATSEEECTNSYLSLCNEYEQEKVEPGALEDEGDGGSWQDARLEVPPGASPQPSGESPPAPVGFLAHAARDGEGRASPPLDRSKRTPMEFFRIDSKDSKDSKDSAGEVTCPDWAEQQQRPPAFSAAEVAEDLPEPAPEVKRHDAPFRGSDGREKDSDESVQVISFREAAAEDEGRPPDLLVNLPVASGVADPRREEPESSAPRAGLEPAASPQRSVKPDVLQLAGQPEGEREREQRPSTPSSVLTSLWDDYSLTFGPPGGEKAPLDPSRRKNEPAPEAASPDEGAAAPPLGGLDSEPDISRLLARPDEPSPAASQARIPEALVRRWAAQLVTALDCLHREGVICRDLNPNNVLLDRRGHVLLTYFCGWSDVEESCDKEAGAAMYCAPEVGGIGEETAACDWWSLGAILFELLTSTSLLQCHPAGIGRHTALNVPESVSEEARSLLEQLLQFNACERLGAGAAGADDVRSHPFFAKVDKWST